MVARATFPPYLNEDGQLKEEFTRPEGVCPPSTEAQSALDVQVGGEHYKELAIQPIEYTMQNNLNFCQGNIIKYVTRYAEKNGIQDLEKAKHYIDLLIEMEKSQ